MRSLIVRAIQTALALFNLGSRALAFHSNKQLQQARARAFTSQPVKPCYLFRSGLENLDFSLARRRFSAISVSGSTTSLAGISAKKLGIYQRVRRVLGFPLRLIVLGPLKLLSRLIIEDLIVEDGTASIDLSPGKTADHTSQNQSESPEIIAALDDVALMPPGAHDYHESSGNMLPAVPGETLKVAAIARAENRSASHIAATSNKAASKPMPKGDRWAVASSSTDLSGNWQVVVSNQFKNDYDIYLASLGQPLLVRTVALGIVGRTTEELSMAENGKCLLIRGTNARGVWDRTLVASGAGIGLGEFTPLHVPVMVRKKDQSSDSRVFHKTISHNRLYVSDR